MTALDPAIVADARDALNDVSSAATTARTLLAPYRFWLSASALGEFDAAMAQIADAQAKLADIIKRAAAP